MSIPGCHRNRDGSLRSDGEVQTEQARLDEAATKATEGEYSDALEIFHAILEDNPTSGDAYLGIGDVYLEQKDYLKAEPALARAAKLEPRSYQAQFQHGLSLQMLDRFLEAVQAYHRALTIDPDSALRRIGIWQHPIYGWTNLVTRCPSPTEPSSLIHPQAMDG